MDSNTLWETTMNPENRVLLQVSIEDAEQLTNAENVIELCMGENVDPRKQFIIENALNAELV